MHELRKLYEDLNRYSDFSSNENAARFLDVADLITQRKDPASIPELIKQFNDNTDHNWVFEKLRHKLETFEKEVYVCEILKSLKAFFIRSPNWCTDFMYHLLDNAEYLRIVRENLHLSPAREFSVLLDRIEADSKVHRTTISELRKRIRANHKA